MFLQMVICVPRTIDAEDGEEVIEMVASATSARVAIYALP
jgi:hypothetical protein